MTSQAYDIWVGIEFIAYLISLLALLVTMVMSLGLFKCLQNQDLKENFGLEEGFKFQVTEILKRGLLWFIGYQGEEREKTPIGRVDVQWVDKYKFSIFFRLFPIYAIFIFSLVLMGRPVEINESGIEAIAYTRNLPALYLVFLGFVLSNVIFDVISLRYSYKHICEAQATKKYLKVFLKDGVYAFTLFASSQVLSCIFWLNKQQEISYSAFSGNLAAQFIEISFWPYAIFSDISTNEIVGGLIPGQLLISGTVFFPTIIIIFIFTAFSLFLQLTAGIKKWLTEQNLERLCRCILKTQVQTAFIPAERISNYGVCNAVILLFFGSIQSFFVIKLLDSITLLF